MTYTTSDRSGATGYSKQESPRCCRDGSYFDDATTIAWHMHTR